MVQSFYLNSLMFVFWSCCSKKEQKLNNHYDNFFLNTFRYSSSFKKKHGSIYVPQTEKFEIIFSLNNSFECFTSLVTRKITL